MPHKDKLKRKEYFRQYYLKNKDKIKKRTKKYREKDQEKFNEYSRIWRRKNPDKYKQRHIRDANLHRIKYPDKIKARNKSNNNIKIPKGQFCVECEKELAKEKHHEDYDKPLEVIFVCLKCHSKLDRRQTRV